jgi:signal transduction histidine kinase
MFTLFFSSKGSKGTGLGLFIANHVIRQHGGRIDVASEYGKGTHVQIRIPRFRADESSIAHPLLDCAE